MPRFCGRLLSRGDYPCRARTISSRPNPCPKVIPTRCATASPTRSSTWSSARPRRPAWTPGTSAWPARPWPPPTASSSPARCASPNAAQEDKDGNRSSTTMGHPMVNPAKFKSAARKAIRDIGYEQDGFHWKTAKIDVLLHAQSADIAQGVESRAGNKDVRRGRPGHHVRLCLPRDARADAGADLLRPQDPRSCSPRPARRARATPASSAPTPRAR